MLSQSHLYTLVSAVYRLRSFCIALLIAIMMLTILSGISLADEGTGALSCIGC